MNFNSFEFLVFLAIVLILYFVLPHKFRWVMLLIASYYFYMSWNASLIFLIFGTTLVSYLAALCIEKTEKKSIKKLWLILTLTVCLGVLAFFKYANFFIASAIDFLNLFKMNISSFAFDILLPVGISFYTFQTLSYVIDVYRGEYKAEKHFGYYALFVSYFPQLVAGPIERCDNLLPQLKVEHKFNADDMSTGLRIAISGFFFKCVVADYCGIFVNNVFGNISGATSLSIFLAGALFCVQMYCDFAGYSEIARGVARMMGIKLMKNFDQPYLSQSYTEFFRRWHISLNQWFTDYLYIPLGGNRKGMARKIVNLFIVFALCGLWHGANWTYVIWGLYAAIFLAIESLLSKPMKSFCNRHNLNTESLGWTWLRRLSVYVIFVFSALIFRSQSLDELGAIVYQFFTSFGFGDTYFHTSFTSLGMNILEFAQVILSLAGMVLIVRFIEYTPSKKPLALVNKRDKAIYAQRVSVYGYAILAIVFCWLTLLANSDISSFAYFQF